MRYHLFLPRLDNCSNFKHSGHLFIKHALKEDLLQKQPSNSSYLTHGNVYTQYVLLYSIYSFVIHTVQFTGIYTVYQSQSQFITGNRKYSYPPIVQARTIKYSHQIIGRSIGSRLITFIKVIRDSMGQITQGLMALP